MSSPSSNATSPGSFADGTTSTLYSSSPVGEFNESSPAGLQPTRRLTYGPAQAHLELMHRRLANDTLFGISANGEVLNNFILIDAYQKPQDYGTDGMVHAVMQLPSLLRYAVETGHLDGSHSRIRVLLQYSTLPNVEDALAILRDRGLPAFCIPAARWCEIWEVIQRIPRDGFAWAKLDANPCNPTNPNPVTLGETFRNGYDGQVIVQAVKLHWNAQPAHAYSAMLDLIFHAGAFAREIQPIRKVNPYVIGFMVELSEHKVADVLVNLFEYFPEGYEHQGFVFHCAHYSPQAFSGPMHDVSPDDIYGAFRRRFFTNPAQQHHFGAVGENRGGYIRRRPSPLNDQPRFDSNLIDWNQIIFGCDTRTTFMLRNIPVGLKFNELKAFLDAFLWNKYDFLYLRMDFSTRNNLGYAFINVQKAYEILAFYLQAGKNWPRTDTRASRFRPPKPIEISYATVQGFETLVNKFRNSAVMLEQYECRPHLYRTSNEPELAGVEQPFPPADNYQKQLRSEQNAINYGLFAAGQNRRQGRLDRGHPRANIGRQNRGTFPAYYNNGHHSP